MNHYLAFWRLRAIPFRWTLGGRGRATVGIYTLDSETRRIRSGHRK